MTKPPMAARENRSLTHPGQLSVDDAAQAHDRRHWMTSAPSGQTRDADVSATQEGLFGSLKQNLTNHWKVQER